MRLLRFPRSWLRARGDSETTTFPSSILAKGMTAVGRLHCRGKIFINGTVQGDVHAPQIVVGSDGYICGTLRAHEALIQGRVDGHVIAFRVVVEGTAEVHGRIFHHELEMAADALLDGRAPWRPPNYFENLSGDLEGGNNEYVQAQRKDIGRFGT
jgi:cytoskeletal protein CcmA (bactofilin family)